MKKRKYERMIGTFILSIVLWIVEIILLLEFFQYKITKYNQLTMMITSKNEGMIVIEKKKKNELYKNATLYWNNQKIPYEILEETKLEDHQYVQLRIKLKWKQNKTNEIINISVKDKKISMVDGIINSWDGDKNNKS
ncbi:MAG: hypothetical protein IKF71_00685 [Bacilli bacterium]|nr:hypothetical protein [Bacilli bacterium]